jgi:6-phosphogluconolactonase
MLFSRMKLRQCSLVLWSVIVGAFAYAPFMFAEAAPTNSPLRVYIGTYTGAKSKGIYVTEFNPATGKLGAAELAARATGPSFLAVDPERRFLYAVGETSKLGGKKAGAVRAFRIDEKTGSLTLLNQQESGGEGPCHLSVDKTGKFLLVANYGSGSIAALPIQADGKLAEASSVIQHQGSSVNRERQAGPHAHFIATDPANRFALTCDLGLDQVLVYRLDLPRGALVPNDPPSVATQPGLGPRHFVFSPDGRFVYVISEIGGTVTTFAYDANRGVLNPLQTVSTLPKDFNGFKSCAEVQIHPSGRFLYGSNRGHDSIAIYAIDPGTGKLSWVDCQSTGGRTPRHFLIDPSGQWLLAENQDSDNMVVFRLDGGTGRLSPTGRVIEVPSPVCAVLVPAR